MCGIVGYLGPKQAAPILLDGLRRLEYRGYDSAGLAVRDGAGDPVVVRAKGRLRILAEKTNGGDALPGNIGIGHTRWATHGEPSEANAHPHISLDASVVGVHNGIIENYQELREKLINNGYTYYSQTDTEVAVNLVDYYLKKYKVGPIDALAKTMVRVRGTYALAVMFRDFPGEIYAARKDSPLIIGQGENEMFLASDVPAILDRTRDVYYMGNLEMARVRQDGVTFFDLNGDAVPKPLTHIEWDAAAAEKGEFEHFMMKEIHEQPRAVSDTLHSFLRGGQEEAGIDLSDIGLPDERLKEFDSVLFVACGSAYHVGMIGQYVLEDLAGIPVRVELASEFRYRNLPVLPKTLCVVISQSGETADSLAALREAKARGLTTLGIVNVIGSSIARESDHVMHTLAGPEIAVATTKAFSAQLIACYILSIAMGRARGNLTDGAASQLTKELCALPGKIERSLEDKERIQWFATKFSGHRDAFFIGRGLDYVACMEGSLKMKEISYVHSEAYAAGELKHGTISLIEEGTLVVCVMTQSELFPKTLSNAMEVQSRGGYLMGLTSYGNYSLEDTADFVVYTPKTDPHFTVSLSIIPLQLMAYYVAVAKGVDIDKPRNLAKSVTVE
ncbi:MAG: glutamine--fructose-6-phosphate transaminase (isomerizing) [Clostridia bacterium]|nr:glutamine--fructose-6-phosphate transaminase (isomerizing) [Clostridia bacterium]